MSDQIAVREKRVVWGLVVAATMLGVIALGILRPELWPSFGVPPMSRGSFADIEAMLAAGEAAARGHDPFSRINPYDSYGRPHVYGPPFLVSGSWGLTVAHTALGGALLVVAWLVLVIVWARPAGARDALALLALLLSPPVMLGLERANNDLLIMLLIAAAAVCAGRARVDGLVGTAALLAGTVWLKLYPIMGFVALGALRVPPARRRWVAGVTGLVTLAGLALYADDYRRVMAMAPSIESIFVYGVGNSFRILAHGWSPVFWAGAGLALVVGVWLLRDARSWPARLPKSGITAFWLIASLAMWVGCLIAGSSFFYRAVWLIPLASFAWREGGAARRVWAGSVVFLWASWAQHYVTLGPLRSPPIYALTVGFQHTLVLVSFVFSAWLLGTWCVERWLRRTAA